MDAKQKLINYDIFLGGNVVYYLLSKKTELFIYIQTSANSFNKSYVFNNEIYC